MVPYAYNPVLERKKWAGPRDQGSRLCLLGEFLVREIPCLKK